MMYLWGFMLGFFGLAVIYHFCTRKYLNPYKLIMVFGKKGAGKTTLLTKLAISHHKQGWTVYSTEPVPYAYLIKPEQIGFVALKPQSVLLIDEVGMIYDNRNYKQFKPEVRDFFKLQRHYKVKCYMFSQTFDVDVKLRNLCDGMYLVSSFARIFSWAKKITRKTVLVEASGDAPSRVDENLAFEPFIFWPLGARFLTYIPKWAPYFDSHCVRQLPGCDFPFCEPPAIQWLTVGQRLKALRYRLSDCRLKICKGLHKRRIPVAERKE